MKTLLKFVLITLIAAAVGCSGGSDQSEGAADAGGEQHSAIDAAEEVVAKTESRQLEEGSEVTVAGKLGCGHCNYQVGEGCSAAIQTAEGTIFILDVAEESEWFQKRFGGAKLEVTGKVRHRGADVMLETSAITEL